MIELLRDRIEAGQAEGQIKKTADSSAIARMLVALADGIQHQWLMGPENTDMLAIFDGFCTFISGATSVGEIAGSGLNGSKAPEQLSSE